ncbi:MAG: lysoplasmalogenase [Lysobacterales bacterium]|jgi:uncharacterized membrane protein YhhN
MWVVVCAIGLIIALAGERHSRKILCATGKLIAASAYIAAAWSAGAADTHYGQILLLGMAFCWMGDLFLVPTRSRALFLLGLASFLLGHLAYIGAFAARGVSWPVALGSGLAMVVFAWSVLRWLRPHLDSRMRRPVWLYVAAISTMMAMAAGAGAIDGNWLIPLGALLFLLSDLSVARDRFIAPGFINRAWGLPMYFCGQIVLATSVAYV